MPIQLSPSVVVQEKDLTNVIPAVSTSVGATIVDAAWGPVMEPYTIDSENALARTFGKPNASNATSWFTAANFLSYASNLLVVRTDTSDQRNAVASPTGIITGFSGLPQGSGLTLAPTVTITAPGAGGIQATATAVLTAGSVTEIKIINPGSGYTSAPTVTLTIPSGGAGSLGTAPTALYSSSGGVKLNNEDSYLSTYSAGGKPGGKWIAKYPGALGNSISVSIADSATFSAWEYKGYFEGTPGVSSYTEDAGGSGDELHIAIIDRNGKFSGTPGTILETYSFLSKASDAKKEDGTTAYYKNVINDQSAYVWWANHPTTLEGATNWGNSAQGTAFSSLTGQNTADLAGGTDDFSSSDGQKMSAFELFSNDEQYDVNLIMCGKATKTVANYVIQNVAEVRKDCVAFVSPQDETSGEVLTGTDSAVATKIIAFKTAMGISSSYAVIDTGYKYQYDRYADQYRWIPLNGDIAGLCARTDYTDDPWFSPAGLNRGQIKNVVKLAYSPRKTDRDNLYKSGINPVVAFPGQGVVLFGDKTMLAKPSAFDRINVRRLFITLEKAIATAAKYQLFEFNDGFTRAQFKNIVEPFLRDVKGRRGVTDFLVVCDETNNTGEVIDTNRFVADIYIKPARSINFIQLNFIATRTGASFSEIAGGSGG